MNEKDILGKHFEFEQGFFDNPIRCGYLDLYQIGDVCCECRYEVPHHYQICHEISFIISGTGKFYANGVAYPVKEGDIFICAQGQEHFIVTDPDSTLRFVYLGFMFNDKVRDREDLMKLKAFYDAAENPIAMDSVDLVMPFMRLVDEFYNKPAFHQEMIEAYMVQLILLTYRAFQTEIAPFYKPKISENSVGFTVYSVICYVDNHIFDLKDIRSISEALGYSYSYLSHLFRNKTGMTLQKYINYKKVEKSLELLKYGNFSVTHVAQRLKYETVQSFSKAFRRTMGFPPSEYVKKQRISAGNYEEEDLPEEE